jgi:hypothetical protein
MRKTALIILFFGVVLSTQAQKQPILKPSYDFTYFVKGDGGANGLTVTYNPDKGYYYCVQAGNADFPLEVFTSAGEGLYATTAKVDTRGFWYNAQKKCFEGTKYMGGTFKTYIDANGYPTNPIMQGNSASFVPPVEQSQVVCNVAKSEMYAYNEQNIYVYNQKNNKLKKKIKITNCPVTWDYINPFAMIYTGYKNYEFGLYDIVSSRLLLFNAKGAYTEQIQMPFDVPVIELFRLGFANDRLFLYDGDYRAWYAYKIF